MYGGSGGNGNLGRYSTRCYGKLLFSKHAFFDPAAHPRKNPLGTVHKLAAKQDAIKGKNVVGGDDGCAEVFRRERELTEIGLGVPQITRLIHLLRHKGIDIRDDLYTVEDVKRELAKLLPRSGKGAGA